MQKAKANLFVGYVNTNGINDLQVCRIVSHAPFTRIWSIHKTFTSKVGKAKQYAERYCRKNQIQTN